MRSAGSTSGKHYRHHNDARRFAAGVAVCLLTFGVNATAAEEPASGPPASIAAMSDNQQNLAAEPVWLIRPKTMDLTVGPDLQLQVTLPKESGASQFAATSGVWTPVDSVSVRAGYGYGMDPRAAEWALCGSGTTCVELSNEDQAMVEAFTVGASWQVSNAFSLNFDYLNRDTDGDHAVPMASPVSWMPTAASHLNRSSDMGLANTEALDVSLTCDIDAGRWGDLELGLQVSRMVSGTDLTLTPDPSEPLTSASFGLGWQKGAFRGDITSRYLDVINQTESATGWTAFDVNFAWRMPWNASVSVGARNVLNTPAPVTDNLSDAEVENFFGRVPYVRYQQDL